MKSFVVICVALICACAVQADDIQQEFDAVMANLENNNLERENLMKTFFDEKKNALYNYRQYNRQVVWDKMNGIKTNASIMSKKCSDMANREVAEVDLETKKFINSIYEFHDPKMLVIEEDNKAYLKNDRDTNDSLIKEFYQASTDEKRKEIIDEANNKLKQEYSNNCMEEFDKVIVLSSLYSYTATTNLVAKLDNISIKLSKCKF